jgi:hypothetical protein
MIKICMPFGRVITLTAAATKKQQLAIVTIANLRLFSTASQPQWHRQLVCYQRWPSFATL